MLIKKINIKNIASFIDFTSDVEFKKTTLIFGTNGSGKSTFASLLQFLDRYWNNDKKEDDLRCLNDFISGKISKESESHDNSLTIDFNNSTFRVKFNKNNGNITFLDEKFYPIKVFNESYTERTIGNTIDISLNDSGLVIGEPNRLLDAAQKKLEGLIKKGNNFEKKIDDLIDNTINEYSIIANSKADVSETISKERLLLNVCEFIEDKDSIVERKKLGYETPEDNLNIISCKNFNSFFDIENFKEAFRENIEKPFLDKDKARLLLNYTDFYKSGVNAYKELNENKCPFCFRLWEDSDNSIKEFQSFLESTYNKKRDFISSLNNRLDDISKEIIDFNKKINLIKEIVVDEGKKYKIDTSNFKEIVGLEINIDSIKSKINEKLKNMNKSILIDEEINLLENAYSNETEKRNKIIQDIKNSIKTIRSQRMATSKRIAKHLMWKIWNSNEKLRTDIQQNNKDIKDIRDEITNLENKELNQDTICTVFNGIIDFLGLGEYRINNEKKLIIILNRDYDISNEGNRISSAQRKLLSLCYFIAEIVSEISSVSELKNYILIFDDPVDSADYIFFHSIAAFLENIEMILQKILKRQNLKFGQIIVMTHNSLLYDRLAKRFECRRYIKKIENVTIMTASEKTMNNYKTYLEYIIRYYKNPKKNKKDMIFIGTLIRRVLEILSNFNDLGSNDFKEFVLDLGKPKLALLANHLSHESFTKVINPLNSEVELKEACKELFEVIEKSHPLQYEYISEYMLK